MTITQKISALPTAPDPTVDAPAEFSQKAVASVLAQRALPGELNEFATQANALAADINAKAVSTSVVAQMAASAAMDAISLVGVNPWVSGTTYAKNVAVISQMNFQTYRRRVAGAGTVDPMSDSTNWTMLTGSGAFIPQQAPSASINLALGNYFTKTLNGNQTLTFDNCPQDGYSFTLEVEVSSGVLTLPASVRTPNNQVYTLLPGRVHLLMFVTKNRGVRWRLAAATNYDI